MRVARDAIANENHFVSVYSIENNQIGIIAIHGNTYTWRFQGEPEYVNFGNAGLQVKFVGSKCKAYLGVFSEEDAKATCEIIRLFSGKGPIDLRYQNVAFEN